MQFASCNLFTDHNRSILKVHALTGGSHRPGRDVVAIAGQQNSPASTSQRGVIQLMSV
jgi:anaerobic selenocysteine-containing dehydrogenase